MASVFIQGPPRSGKTTLIQNFIRYTDIDVSGFYTEEVRNTEGRRIGFDVVDIETGSRIPLARKSWNYPHRIASYSVDVHAFENYIDKLKISTELVVIDEIGKMELLYNDFIKWLHEIVKEHNTIATVPINPPSDIQKIMIHENSEIIRITTKTRDIAHQQLHDWITKEL